MDQLDWQYSLPQDHQFSSEELAWLRGEFELTQKPVRPRLVDGIVAAMGKRDVLFTPSGVYAVKGDQVGELILDVALSATEVTSGCIVQVRLHCTHSDSKYRIYDDSEVEEPGCLLPLSGYWAVIDLKVEYPEQQELVRNVVLALVGACLFQHKPLLDERWEIALHWYELDQKEEA